MCLYQHLIFYYLSKEIIIMNQLRHTIKVDPQKKWIRVDNIDNEVIKVEYLKLPTNFCIYQSLNFKRGFSVCNYTDVQDIRVYIREEYDDGLDFHVYDVHLEEDNYEIKKNESETNFDFSSPIILLTGHAGGGTSIVTKFLKAMGVNAGLDSGPLELRKPHEAMGIKTWVNGLIDNIPVHLHKENFLKISKTYGYSNEKVNLFKIPECNSKLDILLEIFPNLKIISVVKKPNEFFFTTEGSRFNKQSELEIFKVQFPKIEGGSIFHLDFNKFFTDIIYVNKLLAYIGSTNFIKNDEQFEFIKKTIKFDHKSLI